MYRTIWRQFLSLAVHSRSTIYRTYRKTTERWFRFLSNDNKTCTKLWGFCCFAILEIDYWTKQEQSITTYLKEWKLTSGKLQGETSSFSWCWNRSLCREGLSFSWNSQTQDNGQPSWLYCFVWVHVGRKNMRKCKGWQAAHLYRREALC